MRPSLPLLALTLLLILPAVSSLGVVPSSHEVSFEAGTTSTYKLKIVNNDLTAKDVTLSAEGDLAPFISLDQEHIAFQEGERERFVTVTFHQPSSSEVKGVISGRVVARESTDNGGQIAASLSVSSRLDLLVPYDGAYARSSLFIGDLSPGVQGDFVIQVDNQGDEDIAQAQVFLKVYGADDGRLVATIPSVSKRIPLHGKELFTLHWTPDVPSGSYRALATVAYDGRTDETEKAFVIGKREVSVDAITVNEFSLGGIAKFNVLLRNEWNDELDDVHASVEVFKDGRKYSSSATQTVSLPSLGSQLVNAYWDTSGVIPGSYDLKITVFYGDDVSQKTFPITVKQDGIKTGLSGQVVGAENGSEAGSSGALYLLILLVLIVLVINVMLFRKMIRKR